MDSFRTLKNITAQPQPIVFRGKQLVMGANAEENYDTEVAKVFLATYPNIIEDVTDKIGSTYQPAAEKAKYMYLANVTGDPDAPAEITISTLDEKNRPTQYSVPNPAKAQQDLSWEVQLGHNQYVGKDGGLWQKARGKIVVRLPFHRRTRVEKEIGEQILLRAARSGKKVIRSREETDFEPTMTWELNDMRQFLIMVDPKVKLDPEKCAEALKRKAENEKLDASQVSNLLREWKQELLHRIYYRVVDPKYRLPTREEFNELKTGKSQKDILEEEAKAILAKADKESVKGIRKQAQVQ